MMHGTTMSILFIMMLPNEPNEPNEPNWILYQESKKFVCGSQGGLGPIYTQC